MTRNKSLEISGSSEDETFERSSKRVGRKSHKEAREEEVERQKKQGKQPTKFSLAEILEACLPREGLSPPLLVNNAVSLLELQRLGEPLKI